jgi:glycosyltransferase involved in cell wall biosynthesis
MRFSIIIPTRNRPELLDRCLAAIGSLNYPRTGFEVLVVDDGSVPPAAGVVARHADLASLRCFRHEAGRGPAYSRNEGLRKAAGEYVVFTDDDCAPHEEWLNALERAFTEHPAAGLGGGIMDAPENGIFGVTSQLLVTFLYDYAEATGRLRFFCSNNLAFPRLALLDQTGGFEEAFPLAAAEDRDICARWLLRGELFYVPDAVVRHRQNLSAISFLAQHYRYGRGAFQFWARRRSEGQSGNRLESFAFYRRMLSCPFSRTPFPRSLSIFVLLAISQLACAAGYFAERRSNGGRACPETGQTTG